MCGIIAIAGSKNTVSSAIDGLKKLEYRGYDSAGVAGYNDKLEVIKSVGKISNLEKEVTELNLKSVIAHTRWATHGVPSVDNAHPHTSENVVLVHNGIIENYLELKQLLIKKGYSFYSDTDTEVACKYIDYIYKQEKEPKKAIIKACKDFVGSYAFAIMFNGINYIYGIRKDSPLVVGLGEDNYISSDISSFLDKTNKYILINHDELVEINDEEVKLYDTNLNKIELDIKEADWKIEGYLKNGYDHFMLKEMYEQPSIIKNLFNKYQKMDIKLNYDEIHIVACGSAYYAGLLGKYMFEKYCDIPVKVEVASEYRYNKQIFKNTLVILISQSGETADTLAALRLAHDNNIDTLAIVNAIGSTIAREAKKVIYTEAGPEIAVATSKGFTSQTAILALLALSNNNVNLDTKKIYNEFKSIDKVINEALENDYSKVVNDIYKQDSVFFLGRGIDYYLLQEGSLKLKEISYIKSEAYPAGELKHGSISLIDKGTVVVALTTDNKLTGKTVSNVKEVKARGAHVVYITNDNVETDFADRTIMLKEYSEFVTMFQVISVLQKIAYEVAKKRGCDIDKPKNLAKSVTVE